jgi:hypothetical protein
MEPLVANTLRAAASCLAVSFRDNFEPSPLHIPGSQNMHLSIKALFKVFENVDPLTNRQKAITLRQLRKLFEASHLPSIRDTTPAMVADIVIDVFFSRCALVNQAPHHRKNEVCQPGWSHLSDSKQYRHPPHGPRAPRHL